MKASQKGMKLNEIRYFRQPRPYARKRITKMRLLPDFHDLHDNNNSSSKNQHRRSTSSRSSERSRDRCITLDRDQRSREIAWFSYASDFEESAIENLRLTKLQNRDTFMETDPEIEMSINLPQPQNFNLEMIKDVKTRMEPEVEDKISIKRKIEEIGEKRVLKKESNEKPEERKKMLADEIVEQIESRNIEETKEITDDLIIEETVKGRMEEKRKVSEIKMAEEEKKKIEETETKRIEETNKVSDHEETETTKIEETKKMSNAKVTEIAKDLQRRELEKRDIKSSRRTKSREVEKKEIPRKDRGEKSSENSNFEGEKSFWWRYESLRKIIDFFGHLLGRRGTTNREKENPKSAQKRQRFDANSTNEETKNGELSTRNRRSSRQTSNAAKVSEKRTEDRIFYGLTRDTREEKLRATLLEHEMRNRKLEEENRRYKRILEDKLKTRQMSSPLH